MAKPKEEKSGKGKEMHFSVGAVIEKDGKYLLIDRAIPPFGFAGVAGHVDVGEGAEKALRREVKEECGLRVGSCSLLIEEEMEDNRCVMGVDVHYWKVFSCSVSGKVKLEKKEVKVGGWYTKEEMKRLVFEPVWALWFARLGILRENA